MPLYAVSLEQHLQLVAGTPYEEVPPAVLVRDPNVELPDQELAGLALFGGQILLQQTADLTLRVNQSAVLAASGLDNQAIGEALKIDPVTVKRHLGIFSRQTNQQPFTRHGILRGLLKETDGSSLARVTRYSTISPIPTLDPNQLEVVLLLADGMVDREIGERLYLAEDTVASRIKVAMNKTGIRSRTLLAGAVVVADPSEYR